MNVPTIARANINTSYLKAVQQSGFTGIEDITADNGDLTIAYTSGRLIISGRDSSNAQIFVHNLAGQTVASLSASLTGGYAEVPLNGLSNGVYVAVVKDAEGHKTSRKFVLTSR